MARVGLRVAVGTAEGPTGRFLSFVAVGTEDGPTGTVRVVGDKVGGVGDKVGVVGDTVRVGGGKVRFRPK